MYDTQSLLITRKKTMFSTLLCLLIASCGEYDSNAGLSSKTRANTNLLTYESEADSSRLPAVIAPDSPPIVESPSVLSGASTSSPTLAGIVGGSVNPELGIVNAIPAASTVKDRPAAEIAGATTIDRPKFDEIPPITVAQAPVDSSKRNVPSDNQPTAPKTSPNSDSSLLLKPENLKLMGRFRVPIGGNGLLSTTYSRGGLAIGNEGSQSSLYVVGTPGGSIAYDANPNVHIGEIWVPENLSLSNDFGSLPVATFKQPMTNALENKIGDVFAPSTPKSAKLEVEIRGILKVEDKLMINAVMAYDNNQVSVAGHFSRPADLSVSGGVRGPVRVAPQVGVRHAPGPMFHVPQNLQRQYGWPEVATGLNGVSINSTISNGPGTILFSPKLIDLAVPRTAIPGVVLSDYPYPNKTFAEAMGAKFGMMSFDPLNQNPWWTPVSHTRGGGAWLEKFGTVLFSGFRGMGVPYYGSGNAAPSWAVNDPTNSNGAPHAYPYQHVLLLIDQTELIKSFKGEQGVHEVKAYSSVVLDDPFWPASQTYQICGSALDRSANRLYIRKCRSFADGQSLIEVFQIN